MSGKDEELRIKTDIAGSVFMELIGDNMEVFVCIVNLLTKKCNLEVADLRSRQSLASDKGKNLLIPRGRETSEVHWIFQDDQMRQHNPYDYGMQKKGSHQFCQSHALKLAYDYCRGLLKGKQKQPPFYTTTASVAFGELLNFWELLIDQLDSDCQTDNLESMLDQIIGKLFELNRETEPKKLLNIINKVEREFPHNIRGILKILQSDYARGYCPTW
jgi:hypothetical protein